MNVSTAEALEQAWEEATVEEEVREEPEETIEHEEEPAFREDEAAQETSKVVPPEASEESSEAAKKVDRAAKDTPVESVNDKPPVGLSAAAREAWKDTPEAMRKEIAKRETDFARGIQQYAESAKKAQVMERSLRPYGQLFAMNGGANKFLPSLLQTAATLQMGSPIQKAQTAANLIQQFGVDIETLDSVMAGENVPERTQRNSELERLLQERLAPYEQHMQQFQQARQQAQQQSQQQITQTVQQFASDPANEFYNDVRADMADILDLAANRGQEMSLKEAYDKAVALNPELSAILKARQSKQTVQNKRRTASSVSGSRGGEGGAAQPSSMRDALLMAWNTSERT